MIRAISLLLLFPFTVICLDYDIVFDREEWFLPCKDDPDHFIIGNFLNMDNAKFEYISDDVIQVNGDWILAADVQSTDRIEFSGETFAHIKAQWVPTALNAKRKDLCKAIFNPEETLSEYFTHLPKEQQKCPLEKGTVFSFLNVAVNMRLKSVPDPFLQGEYKLVMRLTVKSKDDEEKLSGCTEVPFHLFPV